MSLELDDMIAMARHPTTHKPNSPLLQELLGRHGVEDLWLGGTALLNWIFDLSVTECDRHVHPRYVPVIQDILNGVSDLASFCELRAGSISLRQEKDLDARRRVEAIVSEHYRPEVME